MDTNEHDTTDHATPTTSTHTPDETSSEPTDPDETAAPLTIEHVGEDCFLWATDYPHPDHPGTWVHALERFVAPLTEAARVKVLGENVRRIYGL